MIFIPYLRFSFLASSIIFSAFFSPIPFIFVKSSNFAFKISPILFKPASLRLAKVFFPTTGN